VILASGDFTSDPELKGRFMGPREAEIDGVNITATGDGQKLAVAVGARVVNGDLALGPELRFVAPQKRNPLLDLPPWPALANFMAWSLEHMPAAVLRPFVMSFVTTALAPSPSLFAQGAILVNRNGERFTDETAAPAFDMPAQPGKVGLIPLTPGWRGSSRPGRTSSRPPQASPKLVDTRRNRRDIHAHLRSTSLALASQCRPASRRDGRRHNATSRCGFAMAYVSLGPVQAVLSMPRAVRRRSRSCVLGADDLPIAATRGSPAGAYVERAWPSSRVGVCLGPQGRAPCGAVGGRRRYGGQGAIAGAAQRRDRARPSRAFSP
jgi:fumarate reductase flavoprotein subunit